MNNNYSPLRYPGGKGRLIGLMKDVVNLNELNGGVYIEPYAGGAALALSLVMDGYMDHVVINDYDRSIFAFWQCVIHHTDELVDKILSTPITTEEWIKQRNIQRSKETISIIDLGFSTFFLNRTNRSGILKAGVIGGIAQNGTYKINARFNKETLVNRIQKVASYLGENIEVLSAPVNLVREQDGKEQFITNQYNKEDILTGQMLPHQGLFVKLDVMKKYYFNKNNKIISDYEFVFRYITDGGHIKFINDIVAYYSNGGLSSVEFGSKNYMRVFYEEILLMNRMGASDEQLQVLFKRFFRLDNNDSIKYHIKNIKRIITKKIPLFKMVGDSFRQLRIYLPSKKKHQCNLKCCRWCGRNFEGVAERK